VTLETFTGVVVAVDMGVELAAVLAQERVPEGAWPRAARAWREAIGESAALQLEHIKARRTAEDVLARAVEPLGSDVKAWCGLLGALALADDPGAVAAKLGITMIDIGALGRAWRRKVERDPSLASQMKAAAEGAIAPERVTPSPVVLKPFPWTPPAAHAPKAPARSGFVDDRGAPLVMSDLGLYAAYQAIVEIAPHARAEASVVLGLPSNQTWDGAWRARLEHDPSLRAELAVRIADHRTTFRRLLAGAKPVIRR